MMLIILMLLAIPMFAQGPATAPPAGPPRSPFEYQVFKDGSGNPEYICMATNTVATSIFARTAGGSFPPIQVTPSTKGAPPTLTAIVVTSGSAVAETSSAHGLDVGHRITVDGSSTAALNGDYTISAITTSSPFTLTFTTTAGDATYNNASLRIITKAPRLNLPVWAIQRMFPSSTLDKYRWAWGISAADMACSIRTLYFQ